MTTDADQLSFEIRPHPHLKDLDRTDIMGAYVELKGQFDVKRNLNAGDQLVVTIADADGTVISQAHAMQIARLDEGGSLIREDGQSHGRPTYALTSRGAAATRDTSPTTAATGDASSPGGIIDP